MKATFFVGTKEEFLEEAKQISSQVKQTGPYLFFERNDTKVYYGTIGENDSVNKPAHYTDGKIEVIDFIEDKNLGFRLGNAVKYISRAGKKDPSKTVEDLEKARWYLDREISKLKQH